MLRPLTHSGKEGTINLSYPAIPEPLSGPGGRPEGPCPPCGVCRQVLREFCSDDFPIYLRRRDGSVAAYTLGQLLPESFSGANLEV